MAWHLNRFLTTWRAAVDAEFPHRGKASDGTIGDLAHSRTPSEHNADTNGSVDAWDCDVNLLGSSSPTGTAAEVAAMRTLLSYFQRQAGAQLWIFRGKIANRDVGDWRVRDYSGPSAHDHHAHFQSRPSRETTSFAGDLDHVFPATNKEITMPMTAADADFLIDRLLTRPLGNTGVPTVGVALQTGAYGNTKALLAASVAETQRDAATAAVLAGMQSALAAIAAANGALTPEQVAALTEQVRQAAAAAGAEATAAVEAKLDSLRQHLGDDEPTA